jgi:hypothetical protein
MADTMLITLAMILTAGATIGNGLEKVSGEVKQCLDLRGRWESAAIDSADGPWMTSFEGGELMGYRKGELEFRWDCQIVDEGAGKFKMTYGSREYLGIYRQESGRLVICYRAAHLGRPTKYKENSKDSLYILHDVKPGK